MTPLEHERAVDEVPDFQEEDFDAIEGDEAEAESGETKHGGEL